MKLTIPLVLLLLTAQSASTQPVRQDPLLYMGRKVTITEPETDEDGFYPKGPASICVEGPPRRQCYTAPKEYGRAPTVVVVLLDKGASALLFSAATGGVSGWSIHFALLRLGEGKDLENLFSSETAVSNQSQHEFWNESAVSDSPIFVTADYVWGPDESHYTEHRYMISAFVRRSNSLLDDNYILYYLEDRYMTANKYNLEKGGILNSESEILARLRRIKAQRSN